MKLFHMRNNFFICIQLFFREILYKKKVIIYAGLAGFLLIFVE